MESTFAGVDPSLRGTGVVIINGEGQEGIVAKTLISSSDAKQSPEQRILFIGSEVMGFLIKHKPTKINIEGMFVGKNREKAAQLGGLQYYLRILLHQHNLDYEVIAPNQLKKFVTGKGNVAKDVILMKILRKWKVELDNHNEGDAYGLARMAMEQYKEQSKVAKVTTFVRRVIRRPQYDPDA